MPRGAELRIPRLAIKPAAAFEAPLQPCIAAYSPLCAPRLRGQAAFVRGFCPVSISGKKEPTRVENSGGITASLQGRYASALYELAGEQGFVSAVETDLEKLEQAIAGSPDLAGLIRNPKVSREDSGTAMEAVAELLGLSELTKNFLGVLAANRRLSVLPDIIRAFNAIAAAARGEVTAQVTSAHPLADEQLSLLQEKLKAREGRNVKIRTSVDPELLGGLVVTIGSKRIDSSIRTRLNSLAQAMKG
jgi:F-type H+-transporting ATPase subunit delta